MIVYVYGAREEVSGSDELRVKKILKTILADA